MKKIFLSLIAAVACMSINAQVIKVYKNGGTTPEATYTNTTTDKYKVVFEEAPADPNLLTGKFTVAEGKQVQFTKGNLYWDGSAYHFEANQTDYQTSWIASHVGHFFWSKTASVAYAKTYSDASATTSDEFFFCETNKNNDVNKVDGESGYYALTSAEWTYLINSRTNASSLNKCGVTVTNGGTSFSQCLIIAPDDYSETLKASYTLDEVNAAGLVCLPAAGYRNGSNFGYYNTLGYYWSATPYSGYANTAYYLCFNLYVEPSDCYRRYNGYSVRLVK